MGVAHPEELVRRSGARSSRLLQEYFFEDWRRIQQVFDDVDQPPEHQIIQQLDRAEDGALATTEAAVPGEPGHHPGGHQEDLRVRLTFLEQSRVPVGRSADAAAGSLGAEDASALVDLGRAWGRGSRRGTGRDAVHIHQFVGAVRAGELTWRSSRRSTASTVRTRSGGASSRCWRRPGISRCATPRRPASSRAPSRSSASSPGSTAGGSSRRSGSGSGRSTSRTTSFSPVLRGKVHWPSQAKRQARSASSSAASSTSARQTRLLNRTLKAALLAAESMLEGAAATSDVTELRHLLLDARTRARPARVVARLRTDRMSRRLAPLLALAKLLLGNRSPDLGRAMTATAELRRRLGHERPLRGVRGARLPGRARAEGPRRRPAGVGLPPPRRGSGDEAAGFLLKPDILVWKGRSPRVVADTKWKRLDPRRADLGVSGEDVYQVLAYAHRYATDSAVLIYPHHAAVGRPGLQRDFVIRPAGASRVVVRVVTLDLARLERVPGQVGEAVGS